MVDNINHSKHFYVAEESVATVLIGLWRNRGPGNDGEASGPAKQLIFK